ncbi:MAG: LysE family translocator [Pseudomonadota bacterium]|jgi:threonine/homoserine/homoserine lactone efflux protein
MSFATWWLYVAMTFVICATPGPNMLLVMVSGARHGFRAAVATMAGCLTALLGMLSLSAAGLGALLLAFPAVFDALRLAGAAYLAWLGIQLWRAPVTPSATHDAVAPSQSTAASRFRQGFMVAASNPKAILFAAAFFPQFIDPAHPQLPQFAILLLTFVVIEVGWYAIYAAGGQRLTAHLRKPAVLKLFNRATGGAFVGFALLMADIRK